MSTVRYVYWQDGSMWLGHLEEFPDYMTQGESIEELRDKVFHLEHIAEICRLVMRPLAFPEPTAD